VIDGFVAALFDGLTELELDVFSIEDNVTGFASTTAHLTIYMVVKPNELG
jgi:hypothetical protein